MGDSLRGSISAIDNARTLAFVLLIFYLENGCMVAFMWKPMTLRPFACDKAVCSLRRSTSAAGYRSRYCQWKSDN
jgi:hypothetical protein